MRPITRETSMADSQAPDLIKTQEAQTARFLAIALVCALAGSVVLQYVVLAVLACRHLETQAFEHLFNSWLPVISGLTGSAVTYYLTKRPNLVSERVESERGTPEPPRY